jgi:hypothetical protein
MAMRPPTPRREPQQFISRLIQVAVLQQITFDSPLDGRQHMTGRKKLLGLDG